MCRDGQKERGSATWAVSHCIQDFLYSLIKIFFQIKNYYLLRTERRGGLGVIPLPGDMYCRIRSATEGLLAGIMGGGGGGGVTVVVLFPA